MPSRGLSRALLTAFVALVAVYGLVQWGRAWLHPKQGLDFAPEYVAARMLVDGDHRFYEPAIIAERGRDMGLHGPRGPEDEVIQFSYPPWLVVAYVPISRLPWDVARQVWLVLSTAAVLGAAGLAGRAVAPSRDARAAWTLGGVLAAAAFFPVTYGLMAGQANDLTLLAVVGSLVLLRGGRGFVGGLLLSVAVMWKVFPAFIALFLVARREGRALAGLAAGCALLFLASLPFVGVQGWTDCLAHMLRHQDLTTGGPRNHSLASTALLLFAPSADATPLVEAPAAALAVKFALQLAAVVAYVATLVPRAERHEPRWMLQAASTLVLAVLLAPFAWEHYGVYLLPAFLAAAGVLATARPDAPAPWTAAATGAAFAVWAFLFQTMDDWRALAHGPGVVLLTAKTWAAALLLVACVRLVRVPRPSGAAAVDPVPAAAS